MTSEEAAALRARLALPTLALFARLVGVDDATVYRWERGDQDPRGAAAEVLTGIRRALERDEPTARARITDVLETGGLALLVEGSLLS